MRRTIAVVGLAFLMTSAPAWAQYGQQQFGGTQRYNGKNQKKQDSEHQASNLDRPVSLPNLPDYTGKQYFVTGLSYPNAKDGPGYIQTFNVENTEDQVKSWWKSALSSGNWKITFTDQHSMRGKLKDGSTCTITVEPPANTTKDKMKGCRASYTVYYHQVNRRR
ncbi:hypothetical protein GC174_00045 [bacterium]|nr:hypothetical protein [bacterium]